MSLLLLISACPGIALGEAKLLPQLAEWAMDEHPVRLKLSCAFESLMPFDEVRLQQLNSLISHISLSVGTQKQDGTAINKMTVQVDGKTVLSVQSQEEDVFRALYLSTVPDTVFQTQDGQSPFDLLFGEENAAPTQLEGELEGMGDVLNAMHWLEDAAALVQELPPRMMDWAKESVIRTPIKNIGLARQKITVVIPKGECDKLKPILQEACPMGWLNTFLSALVFEGKQTFVFHLSEEGRVLKVSYQGNCGADEESMRQVKINWTLRRDDEQVRDEFTLRAPAVKGGDKHVITYDRKLIVDENGTACEAGMKQEVTVKRDKTVSTVEAKLNETPVSGGSKLTGTVTAKITPPDAEDAPPVRTLTLTPDVTVNSGKIGLQGTLGVETKQGKRIQTKATLNVAVSEVKPFEKKTAEKTVDLDFVSFDAMAALRDQAQKSVGKALLSPLVLLPREDTLYLSQDLSDEAWQGIVNAAKTENETEEVE